MVAVVPSTHSMRLRQSLKCCEQQQYRPEMPLHSRCPLQQLTNRGSGKRAQLWKHWVRFVQLGGKLAMEVHHATSPSLCLCWSCCLPQPACDDLYPLRLRQLSEVYRQKAAHCNHVSGTTAYVSMLCNREDAKNINTNVSCAWHIDGIVKNMVHKKRQKSVNSVTQAQKGN